MATAFLPKWTGATICILFFFSSTTLFGQEDDLGSEVVNIVKPYTPTISDAFKVKETPVLNDSITTAKKKVEYSIFSVPVASTFTPAKGKATAVEKVKPIKLYDNYATLGFGNYTSILGELYSNFEISRTDNAGFFFKHNSSQGGIDGVLLDDKFYDTSLDANYTSRQRDVAYRLDAGVSHQLFNWYGLNEEFETASDELLESIDSSQNYISGYVGGSISVEDSYFEKVSATLRYLTDSYSSSEFNARIQPQFQFPLSDMTLKVGADFDYLTGSFDKGYFLDGANQYSFLNAGIIPSIDYINNDLTVSIGAAAYLGLDSENSNTDFFIYPRLAVSYRLIDELLIAYGGAEGSLEQNTYYNFKEENPYVSPTLLVAPTSALYEAFGGLKGKLSNSVGYNVRASYGKDENKALFRLNRFGGFSEANEGYENGNSFQVVYDDIKTLSVFGELKVEVSNAFTLGVNASYYNYNTQVEMEAWNLPELEASVFSTFSITEKLYGGASLFFVGERKDLYTEGGPLYDPISSVATEITLDAYVDANVHLGYKVSDRLSVFVKGSNLLSDSYEKWANYKVQSIQGLLGATYKFDW
ncbi:hypothetical protein GCM10008083_28200 [Ulvibacter litoralis]|nr:hypothetical protein GCM10008083_28200 [Ulvibacter litoralis]